MSKQTTALVESLRAASWHAILLSGRAGVGLTSAVRDIHNNSPDILTISPDPTKKTPHITVETIRDLYEQTRGKSTTNQYVIVRDAHTMTGAAQTAFLKLLEEPNSSVRFILTTDQPERLLATVRSRLQHHRIHPLTLQESDTFIKQLGVTDAKKLAQLRFIAEGLPDELERLATDDEYFKNASALVKDAKDLLSVPSYDKLLVINGYRDDRVRAMLLIRAAINIVRKSLSTKPSGDHVVQLERLLEAEDRLRENGNVRIVLSRLVLQ